MNEHDLPANGENFTYAQIVRELHLTHSHCACPRKAALILLADQLIHTNQWAGPITPAMLTTAITATSKP